jgi:hypothetical protein
MSQDHVFKSVSASLEDKRGPSQRMPLEERSGHRMTRSFERHRIFQVLWIAASVLFVISVLLTIYTAAWEYSTRRYLKGFSDAIIPATAGSQEKIDAILNWMASGPSRIPETPRGITEYRDPTETLNYQSLLKVCGSSTNAFINLADSGGLSARRLLLLDSNHGAKHVVAEVLIGGRWIVVDPSFRRILRGTDGRFLTRNDLTDPVIFKAAIQDIPEYDPSYDYSETAHVRLSRVGYVGRTIRMILDRYFHGWEDSPTLSLLLERESFAALVLSILLLLTMIASRVALRWIAESRLGVYPVRIREQFRRAASAFLDFAS